MFVLLDHQSWPDQVKQRGVNASKNDVHARSLGNLRGNAYGVDVTDVDGVHANAPVLPLPS